MEEDKSVTGQEVDLQPGRQTCQQAPTNSTS